MFEIIFRHRCYSLAIAIILFSNPLCSNENNLIYFRKQLGNKGKCSRAVFSCDMLRGDKVTIFLS